MRHQTFTLKAGAALLALGCAATGILGPPTAGPATASTSPTYYVSLGDSYSVGYQPGLGSTPGYTVYVANKTHLKLVNFGCAGATTTSLLARVGCPAPLPHTTGAILYPTTTQAAAAEAFLTAHRGHIGLITVTIGGNDFVPCAPAGESDQLRRPGGRRDLQQRHRLGRRAACRGRSRVPLIGLTYPDVILGAYVFPVHPPTAAQISLAKLSVVAFKALINPALTKAYASAGGSLVDVTAASGAYTSLTRTIRFSPYGTIPVPVASVCALVWFCSRGDIHPKTTGYNLIGKLVVAKFAVMRRS